MTTVITPDATIDTAVRDALTALAAMLVTALDPYGLTHSEALGVDVPDVTPEGGPLAVAVLANGDHALERVSECEYRTRLRVHVWLLVAPTQVDRAEALGTTVDWLIPLLRAIESNQSLGLDYVEAVTPAAWQAFSGAEWAGTTYTGLLVTCDLSIVVAVPLQD